MREEIKDIIFCIVLFILVFLTGLALMGCTSTKYVPVETVKTEQVDRVVEKRDSVHVLDSVITYLKGDTIYIYKYRNVYKDIVRHDTMSVVKHDSICVPIPIERDFTFWEKTQMNFGALFVVVVCLALLWWIGRTVWHRIRSRT
ncbi:MAG: hypothetical protein ACI3YT_04775 [Prevotella sp.]